MTFSRAETLVVFRVQNWVDEKNLCFILWFVMKIYNTLNTFKQEELPQWTLGELAEKFTKARQPTLIRLIWFCMFPPLWSCYSESRVICILKENAYWTEFAILHESVSKNVSPFVYFIVTTQSSSNKVNDKCHHYLRK